MAEFMYCYSKILRLIRFFFCMDHVKLPIIKIVMSLTWQLLSLDHYKWRFVPISVFNGNIHTFYLRFSLVLFYYNCPCHQATAGLSSSNKICLVITDICAYIHIYVNYILSIPLRYVFPVVGVTIQSNLQFTGYSNIAY